MWLCYIQESENKVRLNDQTTNRIFFFVPNNKFFFSGIPFFPPLKDQKKNPLHFKKKLKNRTQMSRVAAYLKRQGADVEYSLCAESIEYENSRHPRDVKRNQPIRSRISQCKEVYAGDLTTLFLEHTHAYPVVWVDPSNADYNKLFESIKNFIPERFHDDADPIRKGLEWKLSSVYMRVADKLPPKETLYNCLETALAPIKGTAVNRLIRELESEHETTLDEDVKDGVDITLSKDVRLRVGVKDSYTKKCITAGTTVPYAIIAISDRWSPEEGLLDECYMHVLFLDKNFQRIAWVVIEPDSSFDGDDENENESNDGDAMME